MPSHGSLTRSIYFTPAAEPTSESMLLLLGRPPFLLPGAAVFMIFAGHRRPSGEKRGSARDGRINSVAGRAWPRRKQRRALCAALVSLVCLNPVCLNPALADVRIENSTGGVVSNFLDMFQVLRRSGQRVVIDGPCYSACTLVLSAIPRDRICVTRRAVLGFHAPKLVDAYGQEYPAPEATTRVVAAAYPAAIRHWISRHGGLREQILDLQGPELSAMYPPCAK